MKGYAFIKKVGHIRKPNYDINKLGFGLYRWGLLHERFETFAFVM